MARSPLPDACEASVHLSGFEHINMPPERIEQLLAQRVEAMRYLGVLIDRLGGSVTITPDELADDRYVVKDEIGFVGVVVLRTEKG